jgi:hypothetical protein
MYLDLVTIVALWSREPTLLLGSPLPPLSLLLLLLLPPPPPVVPVGLLLLPPELLPSVLTTIAPALRFCVQQNAKRK